MRSFQDIEKKQLFLLVFAQGPLPKWYISLAMELNSYGILLVPVTYTKMKEIDFGPKTQNVIIVARSSHELEKYSKNLKLLRVQGVTSFIQYHFFSSYPPSIIHHQNFSTYRLPLSIKDFSELLAKIYFQGQNYNKTSYYRRKDYHAL